MTFRAKPVVKRSHRSSWESQDRRNFYLNLGFGLVVLAAVVILAIAAGVTWYSNHLAPAATVDGQTITIDEFNERYDLEKWRIQEAKRRITNQFQAGRLTQTQSDNNQAFLDQQLQSLPNTALERLIDTRIQATLASQEGVAVSDAEVDARLLTEATIPETRHAWIIEVEPVVDAGALEPTAEQAAEAKAKADAALADLKAGKAWDEVAKTVSTDAATAAQGGDLGWITKDDAQSDEDFVKAVFAANVDEPSAVLVGEDGIYRIARVSEISPETVDALYQNKITDNGLDLAKYRAVVAGDVIHEKLEAKIVADATKPGPQRKVSEIYIAEAAADLPADAIKVRHILYAPKDDPSGASAGDIPAEDPSWAAAGAEAKATWDKLNLHPELFDSIARADSDEQQARGVTGTGGKLPYFDSTMSVDPAFLEAIMAPDLKDGQLLSPVKSAFGWHIIQVMYHPTDGEQMTLLKTKADSGSDFATLARDNSESETAGKGGDLGWVAKGQLTPELSDAIVATPIGKTSVPVTVAGDGLYLFKVSAEETRTPEGRQLEDIKSTAFSTWYAAKKDGVTITRDPSPATLVS